MAKRSEMERGAEAELEAARKANKDKNVEKRLKALVLRAQGKTNKQVAEVCGYHPAYITRLVAIYRDGGLPAIVENHFLGNHRNLSYAEEEALLEPFKKSAVAGQVVEVSEIKAAYEQKIGRSLENNHGQIYRVLARHGWRKIMPRSKHPNKADEEAIEASKKLTV